jgi:hypothetical protein
MKNKQKVIYLTITLVLLLLMNNLTAKDYYISSDGNDKASGLSPEKSIQSIQKLNSLRIEAGDRIFFKAGDRFTGTIRLKFPGTKEKPILLTTYGGDNKATISGSTVITGIKNTGNSMLEAPCEKAIQDLYLNNKIMISAREPNSGFFTMEGGGIDYLTDIDQKLKKEVITGARVRLRSTNWSYEYRNAIDFSDYKIQFDSMLFHTSFKNYYCKKGFGYYLDNKKEFLDVNNEWYWSAKEKKVYFMSDVNPENIQLYGSYIPNGIIIGENVSNIHIQGLNIEGYTNNGIQAEGHNDNINIRNCTIRNIGVIGLFLMNGGHGLVIADNNLYDITGSGIRLIAVQNSIVENNQVRNIGLIPGYGVNGINGAIGIGIENVEELGLRYEQLSRDNVIRNNYIDSTGFLSVRMDGIHNIFEKNILKNGLITLNDGGLIHTYGVDVSDGINMQYTHSSIIRDNIFMNCIGNTESSPTDHKINNGIYLDARSSKFIVENNIVINTGSGILLNDKNRLHTVRNNVCYGNKSAITISQSELLGRLNHEVVHNVFFNTYNRKSTLTVGARRGTRIEPGRIDSNYYISPNEKFHIRKGMLEQIRKTTLDLTLEGWQEESGQDLNSVFVTTEKDGKQFPKSKIFINETGKPQSFKLNPDFEYIDIYGNYIHKDVELQPRKCKIVLYRAK